MVKTTAHWLRSADVGAMLEALPDVDEVRLRCWALASYRMADVALRQPGLSPADLVEAYLTGRASAGDLARKHSDLNECATRYTLGPWAWRVVEAGQCLTEPAFDLCQTKRFHITLNPDGRENAAMAALLREVFGDDPFRPLQIQMRAEWRVPAVLTVARGIQAEGRYQDMAILGDALEESGCDDAAILEHCHRPGKHVLGCWVLQGLLRPGC